jgi:hypothetical protein
MKIRALFFSVLVVAFLGTAAVGLVGCDDDTGSSQGPDSGPDQGVKDMNPTQRG